MFIWCAAQHESNFGREFTYGCHTEARRLPTGNGYKLGRFCTDFLFLIREVGFLSRGETNHKNFQTGFFNLFSQSWKWLHKVQSPKHPWLVLKNFSFRIEHFQLLFSTLQNMFFPDSAAALRPPAYIDTMNE